MVILNLTPDSFSDGGTAWRAGGARAVAEAALEALHRAGPGSILDVGGQSTRPGAQRVSQADEAARVVPVLRALRELCGGRGLPSGALLSVDTFYGNVAAEAAALGAHLLNDVSCGGRFDAALLPAVAASGCGYVLTHSRGEPATMALPQHTGGYGSSEAAAVAAVAGELVEAAQLCSQAGVEAWRLVLDPGLGFGKARGTSRALLRGLGGMRGALAAAAGTGAGALLHAPLLLGPSRKAFLLERGGGGGAMGAGETEERDWATASALAACVAGGADIVRVHNAPAMRAAAEAADLIFRVQESTASAPGPSPR
jgi:2-amino-4-hydroxy-6-hydroxymethyldihydropteridine diphosphokinase/dihydropteroate synthase